MVGQVVTVVAVANGVGEKVPKALRLSKRLPVRRLNVKPYGSTRNYRHGWAYWTRPGGKAHFSFNGEGVSKAKARRVGRDGYAPDCNSGDEGSSPSYASKQFS